MAGPLHGAHALVTGGGRGIGAAIAHALQGAGARVSLIGRSAAPLETMADEIGCAFALADVADESEVKKAVASLREGTGAFTILVNNAGAAETAPFAAMKPDLWQRMIDVNLTGAFLVTQAVLPDLLAVKGGRIVNIASTASLKGYPYVSAYCAAKHGLLGLTRSLALELAGKGVTVNAVCPGYTRTDLLDGAIDTITEKTGMSADAARAQLESGNPQGRLIEPEEVAASVLWLCLPEARGMTGQAISISGGEVM